MTDTTESYRPFAAAPVVPAAPTPEPVSTPAPEPEVAPASTSAPVTSDANASEQGETETPPQAPPPDRAAELERQLEAERAEKAQALAVVNQIKALAERQKAEQEAAERQAQYDREIKANSHDLAEKLSRIDSMDEMEQVLSGFIGEMSASMSQAFQQQQLTQQQQQQAAQQQEMANLWQEHREGYVDQRMQQHGVDPLYRAYVLQYAANPEAAEQAIAAAKEAQQVAQKTAVTTAGQAQLQDATNAGAFAGAGQGGRPPVPPEMQPMRTNSREAREGFNAIFARHS